MKGKDFVLGSIFGAALLLGGLSFAQRPLENVDPQRHPLLAAAQVLCDQAYERISAAQQQNDFDLAGHGAKAKDLIAQASREIKLAAIAANEAQVERDKEKHR